MAMYWLREAVGRFQSYIDDRRYARLVPTDVGKYEQNMIREPKYAKEWSNKQMIALLSLSTLLTGGLSFFLGMQTNSFQNPNSYDSGLLHPSGNVKMSPRYNRTFTDFGPASDAAWASIFPRGVGFIQHPQLSPQLSGIAVFHQIHCVNMLRISYYAALNGTITEMQKTDDPNKRPDPHHVRHCFDYLRQALMCAADTNLEPVDLELRGATGWGYERTCRNFQVVKDWSDRWRSWGPESS